MLFLEIVILAVSTTLDALFVEVRFSSVEAYSMALITYILFLVVTNTKTFRSFYKVNCTTRKPKGSCTPGL